jgi:hypothetical protein
MKRLKVVDFGTECQGIRIHGDPRNPEPESVRIAFPGGDVEVVRTGDGDYWAHVRVDKPGQGHWQPGDVEGRVVDGRQDVVGKHAAESHPGELANPGLYHLAVRVAKVA